MVELQIQGIQKMHEELIAVVEELKKSKVQDSVFFMIEEDEDEGDYMDPIPTPDLTISLDNCFEPRIEEQVPTTT